MLKISHIEFRRINYVLLLILCVIGACYMPRGGFVIQEVNRVEVSNDSIFIALPIEFQVYNYFKVSYDKNREVYLAEKFNDSTVVFISNTINLHEKFNPIRVEAGIIPFFEKK